LVEKNGPCPKDVEERAKKLVFTPYFNPNASR